MKYYKTYNFAAVLFLVAFSGFVGMLFFGSEPQSADAVQMPQQAVLKQPISSDNGSSVTNLVSVDDISDGACISIDNEEESFFMRDSLGELSPIEISSGDLGSSTDLASEMDLGAESGTRTIQSGSADAAASAVAAGDSSSSPSSQGGVPAGGGGGSGDSGSSGASGSGPSGGGGSITLVGDVWLQGDVALLGMKIERSYVTDGAFLVVTPGARFDYVSNVLKIYQGLGNDKRLLSTIIIEGGGQFEKTEEADDHIILQSANINIGIYGERCIIEAKQDCILTLRNNIEPTYKQISDEIYILADVMGGLYISPQIKGADFTINEKNIGIQLNITKNQIVFLNVFSTLSDKSLLLINDRNPQAVKEVAEGKRTVVNAAWWGFDKEDSTSALQAAINSGAAKVVVPCMGADWIVKPIKLAGNQEVIFSSGVVVCAKKSEFKGKNDCLFSAVGKKNIILRGYGATLKMQKADYVNTKLYKKSEWRMGVALYGCSNVQIEGFNIYNTGGDGIYIGSHDDIGCSDIQIKDCICDNNYRQGISIISAERLLIDNCILKNTNGMDPSAGIDIEPNTGSDRLSNIVVSNCVSKNNDGAGLQVYLRELLSSSQDVSVLFVNCYISKCGKAGLMIGGIKDDGPNGLIEFKNCTMEDLDSPGLYIYDKSANRANLRFDNCKWKDAAKTPSIIHNNESFSPIYFFLRENDFVQKPGGVEFINCSLYDNKNRPFISVFNNNKGIHNIKGDISIYNRYEVKTNLGPKSEAIELKVTNRY